MTGESNFYEMDPNWKEEKRPKTTPGGEQWWKSWRSGVQHGGKAQAKDQNTVD